MRALLVFLLFIGYALTSRWYFICEIKNFCGNSSERPFNLELVDETGKVLLENYEQFYFAPEATTPDLTENNQQFLQAVQSYLDNNATQNLTIRAAFRLSEQELSTASFENIGLARADEIRNLVVSSTIPANRITLDYETGSDEELLMPLRFEVYSQNDSSSLARTAFVFENMTFSNDNFAYKSAAFNPGQQFLKYADSVFLYLQDHPDKRLKIIGHTDAIGGDEYNDDLGLKRALNAKKYFEGKGLTTPIATATRGKRDSVARNYNLDGSDNPEGRQKNRRVNFVIE